MGRWAVRVVAAFVSAGLVALAACAGPSTAPAPRGGAAEPAGRPGGPPAELERPPLRVAYVTPSAVMAPLWMAKEAGAFERAGVAVEVRHIQANAAVAALLAGEIDLVQISGPPVLSAVLQGGADPVFIAGALNRMIFSVHTPPEIRTPQDLKGRLFGSDRPGTPVAFGTEVALTKLGLQPSDVQILHIGSSDQLLAALLSGQLAAAVLSPPANFTAEEAGFPKLIDLYDVPYQNIGLAARRARLPALEPALIPFLQAYREGIERYYTDKALALQVIEQYSRESNPEVLEKTYEFYRAAGFNRQLNVSEEGIASILGFLSATVPAARTADPSQFFEPRYVQQLP
jgi:ABC-type nitrate/sulfonate/bicarbonate transport system substrate-binding protein